MTQNVLGIRKWEEKENVLLMLKQERPWNANQVRILNREAKSVIYLDGNEGPVYVESSCEGLSVDASPHNL